jgi:hypothetical protein
LLDLGIRFGDLHSMYTDDGMFSRAEICRRATTIWNWSFHFASGSAAYQTFLFALAALLAIALLVGWETRIAVIGSWLMLVSIHHRVPPILSGAENLQRLLLFWAMFLPLGATWSVDERLARRRGEGVKPHGEWISSMATAAILVQMASIYLFSALFKSNPSWWSGTAIAGSLRHAFFASPLGDYLLNFPQLLTLLTWAALALEWAAAFLLFSPRRTATVRMWTLALLAAMHLSIAFLMEVGAFSFVALAGLTLFLPSSFWNSVASRLWLRNAPANPPLSQARAMRATKPSGLFRLGQGICCALLIYVFALNLNSLPSRPLGSLAPETWRPLTRGLGLNQNWGMFAAVPSRDGWYVARAVLQDGSEVDLLRQRSPVDWKKPTHPLAVYPDRFWIKLFREMSYEDDQGYQLMRRPVAEFLCREWDRRHFADQRVAEFELVFCLRDSPGSPRLRREQLVHLERNGS